MKANEPAWLTITIYACLCLFPLLGLFLLAKGLENVGNAWSSTSWPTTKGRVVRSAVEAESSKSGTMYLSQIAIEYGVHGQTFTTTTLHYGQVLGSGDESEIILQRLRFQEGREVEVSYDPAKPNEAVVHPGMHLDLLWLPGAGLGFFLPGVMFPVLYWSSQSNNSRGMRLGIGMFAVIFMLVGTPMLIAGSYRLWNAQNSATWPTTEGEIIHSNRSSSESETRDEDGEIVRTETFSANLIYRYVVNGQRLYNNVRRFGQLAGADEDWAQEIVDRYSISKKVRVFYRVDNPSTSVLEPGISDEAWYLPGAGAAFFLFGLAVLLFIVVPGRI